MITVRPAAERGETRLGWLDSRHTFSFNTYHDPKHMGFRSLRVINDDRVVPGAGFPTHGHRDMEILTWVLEGALAHRDSTGSEGVLRAGEIQRMSAGTGIQHSEYNDSGKEPVHFLQIWIQPDRRGIEPSFEHREFAPNGLHGQLLLVASPDGRDGSATIQQNAFVYAGRLRSGEAVTHKLAEGRHAWVQVASGAVAVNGEALSAGDGAAAAGEPQIEISALQDSELLLFDLA